MKIEKYIKEQEKVAEKIVLRNGFKKIKTIAGIDQAFIGNKVISGIVVLSYPDLKIIEKKYAIVETEFPYISGLLTYREGPAILACYKKLEKKPDILVCDGSGIAHPRKTGLASHIGVLLDKPSIGVTKSRLVGEFDKRKKCSELIYKGQHVGYALKRKNRHIFISPGHKVSLKTSLAVAKKCLLNKLPEPIRFAHEYVNEVKKNVLGKRCFSR